MRKLRLFSKFMLSVQSLIIIHVLRNFSRSKDNQTMKFGHLIGCNRNIFFAKPYTKWGGEASPRLFCKNLKLSIYLDQQSIKYYTVCFY